MPYINQKSREILNPLIEPLLKELSLVVNPGKINYCFSKIIWELFEEDPSYVRINTLIGILENVKLEFYRRKAADYEDEKILENGDLI